ncbi:type II secretion system F family protein [Inquilinus sp.]|jgi:tight adherence protein B|uniref:type II secretion system F family protein n=1 Tax=Inquilinus sp. TaxID=1932117 RepID=UPI0037840036
MNGLGFLLLGVLLFFALAALSLFTGRVQRRRQQEMAGRLEELRGALPAADGDAAAVMPTGAPTGPRLFQLWQARADVSLPLHLVGIGVVAVAALGAGLAWLVDPVVGLVVAVVLLLVAVFALWQLATRRLNAFIEVLPFFLDAVRQLLIAGNSMQQALFKAADNASPAMLRYLQPMIRRVNNGAAIPDSLRWLATRLDVPELYMLATAVETNFRYGGRMSVVLANLIQILRDRARVGRELKAATAEIRFGAIVLGCMPFAAAAIMAVLQPNYLMFFVETEPGIRLAVIAISLQVVGLLVMRRIMRLEF